LLLDYDAGFRAKCIDEFMSYVKTNVKNIDSYFVDNDANKSFLEGLEYISLKNQKECINFIQNLLSLVKPQSINSIKPMYNKILSKKIFKEKSFSDDISLKDKAISSIKNLGYEKNKKNAFADEFIEFSKPNPHLSALEEISYRMDDLEDFVFEESNLSNKDLRKIKKTVNDLKQKVIKLEEESKSKKQFSISKEIESAMYRCSANNLANLAQKIFVESLSSKKISSDKLNMMVSIIDTEFGKAFISGLIGLAISNSSNDKVQRLAEEFRIGSLNMLTNEFISIIKDSFIKVISNVSKEETQVKELPEHQQKIDSSYSEETATIINK